MDDERTVVILPAHLHRLSWDALAEIEPIAAMLIAQGAEVVYVWEPTVFNPKGQTIAHYLNAVTPMGYNGTHHMTPLEVLSN